jgi:hypothetical protein
MKTRGLFTLASILTTASIIASGRPRRIGAHLVRRQLYNRRAASSVRSARGQPAVLSTPVCGISMGFGRLDQKAGAPLAGIFNAVAQGRAAARRRSPVLYPRTSTFVGRV